MEPAATKPEERPATATSGPDAEPKLSEDYQLLIERFSDHDVTVAEVVEVLKGRAFLVLLLMFSLPFCTPVPLPGLSTPFGAIICVIGLRLALRRKPWLPRFLLNLRLSRKVFPKILRVAARVVTGIEKVSRPRLEFLVDFPVMQHLSGFMIALCGALLLLPLPVPFSNLFPALTIALLAMANIGRDGLFALFGFAAFVATLAFFGALFLGGAAAVAWMADHFRGWFEPGEEHLP